MAYELLTTQNNLETKKIEYISNVPEQETLRDFQLIKDLMRHGGYEIPEHLRHKIINKISQTLDQELKPEEFVSTVSLILRMDEHNLKMVSMAIPKKVMTHNTHTNARSLSDEALLEAIQEVVKKLPPTINT